MGELREYLLEQDIWERKVDELLGNFNDNVTEGDRISEKVLKNYNMSRKTHAFIRGI